MSFASTWGGSAIVVLASCAASPARAPTESAARWTGANGNLPQAVQSIWGASGHVFASGRDVVRHSSDRGLTWTVVPGLAGSVWGTSIDDLYAFHGNALRHSADRGATWTDVTSPIDATDSIVAIWASGPNDVYLGGRSVVAHSRDGAKTWATHRLEFSGAESAGVGAITGTSANDVWIAGESTAHDSKGYTATTPLLARSIDGGQSWLPVAVPSTEMMDGSQEGIRDLCISANGTLLGMNEYSVFLSHGVPTSEKSWTQVAPADGASIACAGHSMITGGRGPLLLESKDDGATWTSIDLRTQLKDPPRSFMASAFIADTGEVYLGGLSGDYGPNGTLVRRGR